jgi:hypothetical protein
MTIHTTKETTTLATVPEVAPVQPMLGPAIAVVAVMSLVLLVTPEVILLVMMIAALGSLWEKGVALVGTLRPKMTQLLGMMTWMERLLIVPAVMIAVGMSTGMSLMSPMMMIPILLALVGMSVEAIQEENLLEESRKLPIPGHRRPMMTMMTTTMIATTAENKTSVNGAKSRPTTASGAAKTGWNA